MKKPFKFDQVDYGVTCACGKPLKENVLARVKEKVIRCYKCWTIKQYNRGHIMNSRALKAAGIKHTFDNRTHRQITEQENSII